MEENSENEQEILLHSVPAKPQKTLFSYFSVEKRAGTPPSETPVSPSIATTPSPREKKSKIQALNQLGMSLSKYPVSQYQTLISPCKMESKIITLEKKTNKLQSCNKTSELEVMHNDESCNTNSRKNQNIKILSKNMNKSGNRKLSITGKLNKFVYHEKDIDMTAADGVDTVENTTTGIHSAVSFENQEKIASERDNIEPNLLNTKLDSFLRDDSSKVKKNSDGILDVAFISGLEDDMIFSRNSSLANGIKKKEILDPEIQFVNEDKVDDCIIVGKNGSYKQGERNNESDVDYKVINDVNTDFTCKVIINDIFSSAVKNNFTSEGSISENESIPRTKVKVKRKHQIKYLESSDDEDSVPFHDIEEEADASPNISSLKVMNIKGINDTNNNIQGKGNNEKIGVQNNRKCAAWRKEVANNVRKETTGDENGVESEVVHSRRYDLKYNYIEDESREKRITDAKELTVSLKDYRSLLSLNIEDVGKSNREIESDVEFKSVGECLEILQNEYPDVPVKKIFMQYLNCQKREIKRNLAKYESSKKALDTLWKRDAEQKSAEIALALEAKKKIEEEALALLKKKERSDIRLLLKKKKKKRLLKKAKEVDCNISEEGNESNSKDRKLEKKSDIKGCPQKCRDSNKSLDSEIDIIKEASEEKRQEISNTDERRHSSRVRKKGFNLKIVFTKHTELSDEDTFSTSGVDFEDDRDVENERMHYTKLKKSSGKKNKGEKKSEVVKPNKGDLRNIFCKLNKKGSSTQEVSGGRDCISSNSSHRIIDHGDSEIEQESTAEGSESLVGVSMEDANHNILTEAKQEIVIEPAEEISCDPEEEATSPTNEPNNIQSYKKRKRTFNNSKDLPKKKTPEAECVLRQRSLRNKMKQSDNFEINSDEMVLKDIGNNKIDPDENSTKLGDITVSIDNNTSLVEEEEGKTLRRSQRKKKKVIYNYDELFLNHPQEDIPDESSCAEDEEINVPKKIKLCFDGKVTDEGKVKNEAVELIEVIEEAPNITKPKPIAEIFNEITINSLLLWTEKYQPHKARYVIGECGDIKKVFNWLHSWKEQHEYFVKKMVARSSKRNSSQQSSDSEMDSDETEDEDSFSNTLILTGPCGCGTTASVYACAHQLDFKVLELNPSMYRTSKQIFDKVSEAVVSHQVHNVTGKFGLKTVSNDGRIKDSTNLFSADKTKEATSKDDLMSLILFEQGDIVYEDIDKGFYQGVSDLRLVSRRPIIITANDPTVFEKVYSEEDGWLDHITLNYPTAQQILPMVQLICLVEQIFVPKKILLHVINLCKNDVRKILLHIMFWCDQGKNPLSKCWKSKNKTGSCQIETAAKLDESTSSSIIENRHSLDSQSVRSSTQSTVRLETAAPDVNTVEVNEDIEINEGNGQTDAHKLAINEDSHIIKVMPQDAIPRYCDEIFFSGSQIMNDVILRHSISHRSYTFTNSNKKGGSLEPSTIEHLAEVVNSLSEMDSRLGIDRTYTNTDQFMWTIGLSGSLSDTHSEERTTSHPYPVLPFCKALKEVSRECYRHYTDGKDEALDCIDCRVNSSFANTYESVMNHQSSKYHLNHRALTNDVLPYMKRICHVEELNTVQVSRRRHKRHLHYLHSSGIHVDEEVICNLRQALL